MNFWEFFKESNGQLSSIRLAMFVIALTACFLAAWAVMRNTLTTELIGLVGTMLLIGIGAKAVQKFAEDKTQPPANG